MQLRAFFDGCGRVYVARATDTEWLNERKAENGIPTLDVVNEDGGEIVTPEEIEYNFRYAEKKLKVTPYFIIYIDDEVKEYCFDFNPYAQQ